ncbi:hypothetical protein ACMFMG_002674 [Clarireedia jacksonii]
MATTLTTSHVTKAFEKIVDPFRNQGASLSEVMDTIEAYADPNIVFHVVGQEFSLGCHLTGFEAMKNHVQNQMAPSYLSALDTSKEGQQKLSRSSAEWMTRRSSSSKAEAFPLQVKYSTLRHQQETCS